MMIFGVLLMLVGLIGGIPFLWTVGLVLLIVGVVLLILGRTGHAFGGRSHYY